MKRLPDEQPLYWHWLILWAIAATVEGLPPHGPITAVRRAAVRAIIRGEQS